MTWDLPKTTTKTLDSRNKSRKKEIDSHTQEKKISFKIKIPPQTQEQYMIYKRSTMTTKTKNS